MGLCPSGVSSSGVMSSGVMSEWGFVLDSEKIMGLINGGSILVHVGTNNTEGGWEGTTAIVRKYTQLVRRAKQTRVEEIR